MSLFQNVDIEEKIGIIGAGNMGSAIITSLTSHGYSKLLVSDKDIQALERVKDDKVEASDNKNVANCTDVLVLAVKPQDLEGVLSEIRDYTGNKLVISIAAGKSLEYLEKRLGNSRIVRTMPFLGLMYGYGTTAYTMNKHCNADDKAIVEYIFNKNGRVFEIEEEHMAEITLLASLPGLLAKYLETVESRLSKYGLEKEITRDYTAKILRTNAALIESGEEHEATYRRVASEGGTTWAAHRHGENNSFYKILEGMVDAAIERCRELNKR